MKHFKNIKLTLKHYNETEGNSACGTREITCGTKVSSIKICSPIYNIAFLKHDIHNCELKFLYCVKHVKRKFLPGTSTIRQRDLLNNAGMRVLVVQ